MADTTIKLSGTYDSIEAYELLEEMRGVASSYLPLTGGEISGDLIVDGEISGNLTGTASGNLPLSGGTMTGEIQRSGNIASNTLDTSWVRINGGTSNNNGANLLLYGKSHANTPGRFFIIANDGTNSTQLIGIPGGDLTWGGTSVSLNGHTHSYLPLSGGTMTGAISRSGIAVNCTNDTSLTQFLGGTDTTSSYIVLYGKNHSSNAGVINIRAYDGTNSSYLKLTPTGDLTWGGKDVERVHAYSISASTGYVRYTSGLQIVWGDVSSVGTTAVEETYAVAFSAYPSVVATANSSATIYINANNSTRFTVRTASGTTTVRYIAIGKWQ